MYQQITARLTGAEYQQWEQLLKRGGLVPDTKWDNTVLLWEDGKLMACGSRKGNLLKCIAVDPAARGEGLLGSVLTGLKQEAFDRGYDHLFLYTKPGNRMLFAPLFFYPVAKSPNVLLMENRRNGIASFLDTLEAPVTAGKIGAIVMNADPFTRGHQYLIRQAAERCDWLYVFVLSEEAGCFRAGDRLEMVRRGTAELNNVTVHPTGDYLISSATFPSYFLKEREKVDREHCKLDLAVFTRWFVPKFSINCRFAGTEPNCPVTRTYNEEMARMLPDAGVEFTEIPRLEQGGAPVSAGAVRSRLARNEEIRDLVPESTYLYLQEINRI